MTASAASSELLPTNVPASSSSSAVFGVPLMPGERVVHYQTYSYTIEAVLNAVLGVMTMCFLVGFYFLGKAMNLKARNPAGFAVTTHRVILGANSRFNGGRPIVVPLSNIADVEAERRKVGAMDILGGDPTMIALDAAASGLANSAQSKTQRRYWLNAEDVVLILSDGTRVKLGSQYTAKEGMFLCEGLANGGFDGCPDVRYA